VLTNSVVGRCRDEIMCCFKWCSSSLVTGTLKQGRDNFYALIDETSRIASFFK